MFKVGVKSLERCHILDARFINGVAYFMTTQGLQRYGLTEDYGSRPVRPNIRTEESSGAFSKLELLRVNKIIDTDPAKSDEDHSDPSTKDELFYFYS